MRYRELDIARGFTVMLMPAVHVTMLYGNEMVYHSWLGIILNWVAEFPGAQLFMLLMGMSFSLSFKRDGAPYKKMLRWFIIGYLLNTGKFILPAVFGWLPASFYSYVGVTPGWHSLVKFLLVGDIMQFAAISLGLLYASKEQSAIMVCFIIVVIAFISPLVWNCQPGYGAVNEFISLITGNDPLVFFPVFPWAVYPLTGHLLGQRLQNNSLNYTVLALTGLILMIPELIVNHLNLFAFDENLYRSLPLQTFYHLGFCFLWLCPCVIISKRAGANLFITFLHWCSRHITIIYCTQWILIFWCISLLPYRGLGISPTLFYSILLTALVFVITKYFTRHRSKT